MLIGLTYDLRADYVREGYSDEQAAEFEEEETIDAIERAIRAPGHTTDRIGSVRSLARRLVEGDSWDLVFNIAEGVTGFAREAQVPALLDAFAIPYVFSEPLVLAIALHKGFAKSIVRDLGIATPEFVVVERLADLQVINIAFPVFAKPVAEGSSKGISGASKADDAVALHQVCAQLFERFCQPVLIEAYLPGREFTVGIVGTGTEARTLGALEVLLGDRADPGDYTFANKRDYAARVRYRVATDPIAKAAETIALAAWRGLGCRDGGRIDLRCDTSGKAHFLEVNPLAGLHPLHSDLVILGKLQGIRYEELIRCFIDSALRRTARAERLPSSSADAAH